MHDARGRPADAAVMRLGSALMTAVGKASPACGRTRLLAAAALLAGCSAHAPPGPAAGGAFRPAPTPDESVAVPSRPSGVEVAPAVLSPFRDGFESNGYPTGSVYRNFEDDPTSRGPGVRLTAPTGF